MVFIQRRNFFEAVRPELVLIDWRRKTKGEGDSARDVISFGTIRNVGRGVALRLLIAAHEHRGNRPTAGMRTRYIPILAPNESAPLNDGEIILWWKNVPEETGTKIMRIDVRIFCWDSRSIRHETVYGLLVTDNPNAPVAGTEIVAPSVSVIFRTTTSKSMRKLKVLRFLQRIVSPVVATFRWIAGLSAKLRRQHPGGG